MKYVYLLNNKVHEIIDEIDKNFPDIPIGGRYAQHFLDNCIIVEDGNEPPIGYIYKDGMFNEPLIEDINKNNITLTELAQLKNTELSQACNQDILSGFLSSAKDNTEKHYDCEYTDQSRIAGLVSIAQLRLLNLSAETIKWKETNALECVEWTPEEILQLGLDLKRHIESKTDKFYQLRIQVLDCTTQEEINNIVW